MRKFGIVGSVIAGLAASTSLAAAAPSLVVEAFNGTAARGSAIPLLTLTSSGIVSAYSFTSPTIALTFSGTPVNTGLTLSDLSVSATAGATVTIVATELGLTAPSTSLFLPYAVSAGPGVARISYYDYVSPTNASFDLASADLIAERTLNPSLLPQIATAFGQASGLRSGGTYSETVELVLTFASAGAASAATSLGSPVAAVPEPASAALLGAGLLGLGGLVRRRRDKAGATAA